MVSGRELEGVIHLNCIKRADLGTETTTHTGIILNHKLSNRWHRLSCGRILRLGHMDHLWRTDTLTLETGGTELVACCIIVEQDGHIPIRFGQARTLFGVLLGKCPVDIAKITMFTKRLAPVSPDHGHALQQPPPWEQSSALHSSFNGKHLPSLNLNRHRFVTIFW